MTVYGSARQQLRRRRLFGEAVVTHAGQTRHITNNQQLTTTKLPTMNRHLFYGASSECRQLNLDARRA